MTENNDNGRAVIPPAVRSWIYSVLTPLSVLLTFYGITSEKEAALWVALVTAAVQGGTAIVYRPTKSAVPGDNPVAVEEA